MPIVENINSTEKKVIIADVDETICETCQVISDSMAKKINELITKGYQLAFISGTKVTDLKKMISSKVTEKHHILGTTGTNYTIIENQEEKNIYNYSFTEEEKKEIFTAFEKLINRFNIESMTTKKDQLQDRKSQITLSAIGRNAPILIKKGYDPQGEKRKVWREYLKPLLGEKYDIKIGGTTSVDVTRKGLDKEWGIKEFAKHNNIPLNNIIFFGDKIYPGGNDYPATRIVDCIAVKNPEDTLSKLKEFF
jgi:phosphomannomutase